VLSISIAIQERIKFAGCKPRIRFARQGAMIARINCKTLIARSSAILQLMT
jgi:uridine phosphorylase